MKEPKQPHGWGNNRTQYSREYKLNRALAIERDGGRCTEFMRDGTPCRDRGTECDHIIPRSQGGGDDLENLRMLCAWHHKKKTDVEKNLNRQYLTERRPKESHPGWVG